MEEGLQESNPVGRGRYTPSRAFGGNQRGLVPRLKKLPWIPSERQWLDLLDVARKEPVRNRLMLALAYDAALRREELCSLRTDDLDPAHRTLRVRGSAFPRPQRCCPSSKFDRGKQEILDNPDSTERRGRRCSTGSPAGPATGPGTGS
ncbi:site-specific integrase [Embleya sp. NPDC005575]|uniref:site-specific integrase n=1 Tax=Embleya sp. NPDC005575 TaxID=3156892 RepID=UPI0033B35265